MKTIFITFLALCAFITSGIEEHELFNVNAETSKKYFAFAVAYSSSDGKAYVSRIHTCTFQDDEATGDVGVTYKSFATEWRDEVVKHYNLNSFYNTQFLGWYETLDEAQKQRDYQISFHKDIGYNVNDSYQFSFSPKCN